MNFFKPPVIFVLLLLCTASTGCLFDNGSDTITGSYTVDFIDLVSTRSIHRNGAEIVPAYVFAVGHNKRFIVAQQHPVENGVMKDHTNYYIVDMDHERAEFGEGVYVTGSFNEFSDQCKEMGVGEINFDMKFKEFN